MVDTISNMQLYDLYYKTHGGKILRYLIYRVIGVRFCPPTGSQHNKIIQLDHFHGPSHINDNYKNSTETALSINIQHAPSNLRK